MFWKKKHNSKSIEMQTYKRLEEMCANNEQSFYIKLDANEHTFAREWCNQHRLTIELDHMTDGDMIYKIKRR